MSLDKETRYFNKLLALVYANLVEEYQSALFKGRYIQNHIRLIQDMSDYQSMLQSVWYDLILFIDFFKAFELKFIFTMLNMFGFGEGFWKVTWKCFIITFIVMYPSIQVWLLELKSCVESDNVVQLLQNCLYNCNASLLDCQSCLIKSYNFFFWFWVSN